MSESKGGQRQLEKKSKKIASVWRQGLSASVKSYYLDRNPSEEREILPYKRLKRSKLCKITKGEHVFDHFNVWYYGSIRDLVCKCGKILGMESQCRRCGTWGKAFRCLCEKSIRTNDEPVPCASLINEDGRNDQRTTTPC